MATPALPPPINTSSERLKSCIDLANAAQARFHGRREIEWKVTIGVWTLLAGASVFVRSDQLRNPFAVIGAVSSFIGYIWWTFAIWQSNYRDKQARDHYLQAADNLLIDPAVTLRPFAFRQEAKRALLTRFAKDGSPSGHFLTTVSLVILACSMIVATGERVSATDKILQSVSDSAVKAAAATENATKAIQALAERDARSGRTAPQ